MACLFSCVGFLLSDARFSYSAEVVLGRDRPVAVLGTNARQ